MRTGFSGFGRPQATYTEEVVIMSKKPSEPEEMEKRGVVRDEKEKTAEQSYREKLPEIEIPLKKPLKKHWSNR